MRCCPAGRETGTQRVRQRKQLLPDSVFPCLPQASRWVSGLRILTHLLSVSISGTFYLISTWQPPQTTCSMALQFSLQVSIHWMTTRRGKRQCPYVRDLKKMHLYKGGQRQNWSPGARSYHALHPINLTLQNGGLRAKSSPRLFYLPYTIT